MPMDKINILADIDGRSRNGWIKVKAANVWHLLNMGARRTGQIHVEFRSKRIGDTAPLLLKGDENDMLTLFEAITAKIRENIKNQKKLTS